MSNRDQLFTPPPFENHSPLTWYQAAAEQPNFIRDEAQARAIEYLDRLWIELMMFKTQTQPFSRPAACVPLKYLKGLYFLWRRRTR